MKQNQIYRAAGWSAYLSGIAAILTLFTVPVFIAIGLQYDLISAVAEIFWFALILPIAYAFYHQLRPFSGRMNLVTFVVGAAGLLYSTIVTFLINFGPVGFGDDGVFITATIGFWFLFTSFLLLSNKLQPCGLSWLGIFIGVSYVVGLFGLFLKEKLLILFGIHVVLITLIYPIWAFWTGRALMKLN